MESYPGDDEKWKLSKKGRSRSMGQAAGTSMLSRSCSASVGTTSWGQQQQAHHRHRLPPPAAASSSSSSQSGAGLSKKCVDAVKEHRARFYIVRRCVSMLVCWRDH